MGEYRKNKNNIKEYQTDNTLDIPNAKIKDIFDKFDKLLVVIEELDHRTLAIEKHLRLVNKILINLSETEKDK